MSSVSTDFSMYFENKQRLDFVFSGLQLHQSDDVTSCANYFKPESPKLYELLNTESMEITSLTVEDDCLISGAIEGETISYNPEALFSEMASIGCKLSIINDFHDEIGEYKNYAYDGTSRVKPTGVFSKLKQVSPTTAFKSALTAGKAKEACELIESGVNPDTLIDGIPAIEHAAQNKLPTVVKALVKKGADISAIPYDKIIDLINSGIDLELKNIENGKTPLLTVASRSTCEKQEQNDTSKLDILKYLVKNKANINAKCKYGGNIVWYGSIDNSDSIIEYLNSIGVTEKIIPSNAYNKNQLDNLETAIIHKDYDYFTDNIINNISRREKVGLLQKALVHDDAVIATILIEYGIGPLDISEDYNETLIDLAKKWESKKILELFSREK